MQDFDDIGAFITHLSRREAAMHAAMRAGLEHALLVIQIKAKAEIGHYQPAVADFPAWAPLAASTEAEKAKLGAPPGAPLLRFGGLRDSFRHEVLLYDEGAVGSIDPTLVFHEFGTATMPPRPVMGPAVVESRKEIERILGRAIVAGVLGGRRCSTALATSAGTWADRRALTPRPLSVVAAGNAETAQVSAQLGIAEKGKPSIHAAFQPQF